MSNGGGGAEEHARFKQYEYKLNSNLVLTTDSLPSDTHEFTGEPESLYGKIDPKSFGDRVARGRPPELDENLKKSLKRKETELLSGQRKRSRLLEESVFNITEELVYQPKTKETRFEYEIMLSIIQQQLGGKPLDFVIAAADEILGVLKNDDIKNPDKKEIENLLKSSVSASVFDSLVKSGKMITDYQEGGEAALPEYRDGFDNEVGVAVEFEENDGDSDFGLVQDDDDDDDEDEDEDEDPIELGSAGTMQIGGGIRNEAMPDADEVINLNVQDIDAYWLQRKMCQAYDQQI